MSNPISTVADHQPVLQNAGIVTSETPANPAQVQYQIQQPNVSNEQSGDLPPAVHPIQQQYAQHTSLDSMPQQRIRMPPNVTNFATNQQSDNNEIPNSQLVTVPQQNPPPLHPPTIVPLLSQEPDQGAISGDQNTNNNSNNSDVPITITQEQEQKSQQQTSPQKTVVTKVRLSDELNIFDWFRTTDIINQIAERAKSSVDSVITALDPGMKEYLYSGGNINILVISDFDALVSPIRDVFQTVFGRATVAAARTSPQEQATSFPIKLAHGFNEAITVAQQRIKQLRLDTSNVPQNQVIVALQPTIVHVIGADENLHGLKVDENIFTSCYLTYCLVLEDPVLGFTLTSYSQLIPLDAETMSTVSPSKFPQDSPYHNLGFTVSIDDIMNSRLKTAPQEEGPECQWLIDWAGLEIVQVVHDLGSSLAHLYRRKWTDCVS